MSERVAIVGTAQSWVETPWNDPGLSIWFLNDGYIMRDPKGNPPKRIDQHFDLHPIDKMWFRPKTKMVFRPGEIPEGVYVRPEGHLEWLQEHAQTIPVWLQSVPDGWPPNARRFPFEDTKKFLRARPDQDAYIASSPVQMVAHAILQGAKEIQIYGIHLATQGEYIKQRPNFEWLLGKAEAMGVRIILPQDCPLLKHSHVYGYEPEPAKPEAAALVKLQQAQKEYSTLATKLAVMPRWKSKAKDLERLTRVKSLIRDAQQEARHAVLMAGG